jgi:hypothetical protein
MNRVDAQRAFYAVQVPEQFNRTLENQTVSAQSDRAAEDVLAEMQAVRTSILVEIEDGDDLHRHAFDIERGRMQYVDAPAYPAFLILGHTLEDLENIRRECGQSLLGFLGGLAGLGDEMRITSQRVRSLRELNGSLVFERVGDGGFRLFASFGVEKPASEPRARIRIEEAIYARLRQGELDPQDAFLDGLIEIEGDVEMAIGLALAALSPE